MIAKNSKLILLSTDILESNIVFHPNSQKGEDIINKMAEVPVNIDFDIKTNDEGLHYVFATIEINNEETADFGYSINVMGASVFDFEEGISEKEKNDLIPSGVNIAITNLRAYIKAETSYFPLGSFSFHSIDMNALFEAKANEKRTTNKE